MRNREKTNERHTFDKTALYMCFVSLTNFYSLSSFYIYLNAQSLFTFSRLHIILQSSYYYKVIKKGLFAQLKGAQNPLLDIWFAFFILYLLLLFFFTCLIFHFLVIHIIFEGADHRDRDHCEWRGTNDH
jgi:hypothetical protein